MFISQVIIGYLRVYVNNCIWLNVNARFTCTFPEIALYYQYLKNNYSCKKTIHEEKD